MGMSKRSIRPAKRDPHEPKAVAFVHYLHALVRGRLHQWRMLSGMPTTAEAVYSAVQHGWIECEGGHSVALTDAGRQMVHQWEAQEVKRGAIRRRS
jgi:hypothetical protein